MRTMAASELRFKICGLAVAVLADWMVVHLRFKICGLAVAVLADWMIVHLRFNLRSVVLL